MIFFEMNLLLYTMDSTGIPPFKETTVESGYVQAITSISFICFTRKKEAKFLSKNEIISMISWKHVVYSRIFTDPDYFKQAIHCDSTE